ncbi:MAG TPA: hypothetical protein VLV78_07930 [Thermoanaerobaculia bacterium]|nr:hypothetical protein [Thermoanaerobaculia bacterium]
MTHRNGFFEARSRPPATGSPSTVEAAGQLLAHLEDMKKLAIFPVALLLVACMQEKTTTSATVGDTGTVQTSTHTETTTPAIDTATTAAMKSEAKEAVSDVKAAAKDAAYKTGTAMETAGKAIQKKTKKN